MYWRNYINLDRKAQKQNKMKRGFGPPKLYKAINSKTKKHTQNKKQTKKPRDSFLCKSKDDSAKSRAQRVEPRILGNNRTKTAPNQRTGNTCLAGFQNCYPSVTVIYCLFSPLFQWEDLSWVFYTCPAIICCTYVCGLKELCAGNHT